MQGEKGREIACQARVMGAMNAIIAATRTNAAMMRMEKEVGTIEEGKRADIIVLDADLLADTSIFADSDHLRMGMRGEAVVTALHYRRLSAALSGCSSA